MKVNKHFISFILVFVLCLCSFFVAGCLNNENDADKQNTDITQNENERDDDQNNNDNNNDNNDEENKTGDNDENQTTQINIVGFGDSISAGYALEGSDMYNAYVSYVNGEALINSMCFTNIIANQLKSDDNAVNVKSYAESGDTTADLINKLNDSTNYPNLENDVNSADIITLCIGANNVLGVALNKMADYFAGNITDAQLDELFAEGVQNFKNDYTNTIVPYLTQGTAKVYVMTVYDPYLHFNFEEVTMYSSNEYIAMFVKAYIENMFNNLKTKAIGYMDQINEYIKSQELQNVIVVDVDANFKTLSQQEYKNYINADSTNIVVNIDEVFDIQTFTIKDASVLQNNQYFDPHPTSLGQSYIANLFIETINLGNNLENNS